VVDKTLTYSEVHWRYITVSWELRDLFPQAGAKITILVNGQDIEATINERMRIRASRLFKILEPKAGDVLRIIRKDFARYEMRLRQQPGVK